MLVGICSRTPSSQARDTPISRKTHKGWNMLESSPCNQAWVHNLPYAETPFRVIWIWIKVGASPKSGWFMIKKNIYIYKLYRSIYSQTWVW